MTIHHGPPRSARWLLAPRAAALLVATSALALAGLALPAGTAAAATPQTRYVATTGADTSAGSANDCTASATPCSTIKHALDQANAGDTISLGAGTFAGGNGQYQGDLTVTKNVTIVGDPGDSTIVCPSSPVDCSATFSAKIVDVSGADLTLRDVTISGGMYGVSVDSGSVTLLGSTVTGNTTGVWVSPATSSGATATGGTVTITDSTIAGNTQYGVHNQQDGSTIAITDSTIAHNGTAYGNVGVSSFANGATVTMAGTLLANNGDNGDLAQCYVVDALSQQNTLTDLGHNLSSASGPGNRACFSDPTSTYDPTLVLPTQLTANGGGTPTLVPPAGSAAIDAIPAGNSLCTGDLATDQRGISRPQGAGCDIGAVERSTSPVIGTSSLPDAILGAAYSQTLSASDGTAPYTWAVSSGSLPAGLSLDSSTGTISGTPTAAATSDFTVTVTDSASTPGTASADLSITSAPAAPVAVATSSLPDGGTGTAYSQTLAATGGAAPYTWAVTSGSLPAGLSLDSATGTISGTPTAAGTSDFTVTATDSLATPGTASADLSLKIAYAGPSEPRNLAATGEDGKVVLTWDLPTDLGSTNFASYMVYRSTTPGTGTADTLVTPFVYGTTYTDSTVTNGTTYYYVVVASALGGKSPASNEASATPAALAVGTASLPDGTAGSAYSQSLTATGGTAPYTWAVSAGTLPDGLSLDASTGKITGTPTTVGTSSFTVSVTDSATAVDPDTFETVAAPATATADLSITVAAAPPAAVASTTKLSVSPASGTIGTSRTVTATVTKAGGGTPTGKVTFTTGTTTATVTLSGGKAVWVLPRLLAVGTHPVTASYAGDATTEASKATAVNVTVTKASATVKAKAKAKGTKVTITLTVTAPAGVSPAGTVTVKLQGKTKKTVKATVNSRGVATVTIKKVKHGKYKASVAYAGNSSVNAKSLTTKFKA